MNKKLKFFIKPVLGLFFAVTLFMTGSVGAWAATEAAESVTEETSAESETPADSSEGGVEPKTLITETNSPGAAVLFRLTLGSF
ncbi:MAG: hypothetical protein LBL80_04185 [Ruminococcus sp.]|jgi:hypothetical protein|nr:hypothetical protein [Ruminococcus sp.]